jgi:NAD(P)H-quinone oxidoreductase subunit L
LDLQSLLSGIPQDTLLVVAAYVVLAGLYLLVVPLLLFLWMNRRWHRMGNVERLGIYGLVFLFFPGMVVFAPFLNFRLSGQGDS